MKRTVANVAECSGSNLEDKRQRTSGSEAMDEDSNGVEEGLAFLCLNEAFDALAAKYSERAAVEDEQGNSWTYAQLQAASIRVAAEIGAHKPAPDGRSQTWPAPVALLMRRSSPWVASVLAAMRVGVPSLSLSGDLRTPEEAQRNKEALIEHRPFLLVLDNAFKSICPPLHINGSGPAITIPVVDSGQILAERKDVDASKLCSADRHPDEVLYIVYTGGTTSASKSVAVTHRMALHELKVYPDIAPLQCTDRVLHQSSAYWGATSLGIFDVAWACGGCLVMTEAGAGPGEVAAIVNKAGITTVGIVPSVLEALETKDCQSLRVIFTWGEALSPSTATRWSKHAALLDLLIASEYWLILISDYRSVSSSETSTNGAARAGFRPVPGARLTLLPPEREGFTSPSFQLVPDGEVGELYMAGPMVSATGYTNVEKNRDAFVDLPVGIGGSMVRHFRTRDLARRKPDGSLEYCGRADGFAKVGGKWLDLAAVERRLVSGGCEEAALVWDDRGKRRHAAVVLEKSALAGRSLFECTSELQRMLPRDTRLHVRARMPHNAATGKLNRGRLLDELTTETSSPSCSSTRASTSAAKKAGKALAIGLLLAGRAGARGALATSLAWRLAPGMQPRTQGGISPALAGLPSGLAEHITRWAVWHSSVCSKLPAAALRALPFLSLLLLDAQSTGTESFARFFEGPLGLFGLTMVVARSAKPWVLQLLMAAGAAHARKRRGGSSWPWAFWMGFPHICDQWEGECWNSVGRGKCPHAAAGKFLQAAARHLPKASGTLPALQQCAGCSEYVTEGAPWRNDFYCTKCNDQWNRYMEGDESALPADTPMPKKAWEGGSGNWHRGQPQPYKRPGLFEIEFPEDEVQRARACMPEKKGIAAKTGACSSKASTTTPVGRIVERCAGVDASDPDTSLASIESLKLISIVSNIRRELGIVLAAGDVARCTCLRDLEKLCEEARLKTEEVSSKMDCEPDDGSGDWAAMIIPRFWKAPVGWLIRLDKVPQERAMHAAACALVRRHPGLRATPYNTKPDEFLAEMGNRAAPVLLVLQTLLGDFARELLAKAAEGVVAAWPRTKVTAATRGSSPNIGPGETAGPEVANYHYLQFSTMKELRDAAWIRARSRGFKEPAQICVLVLTGSGAESKDGVAPSENRSTNGNGMHNVAYLHVAINHAVCDAFCVVPLLGDMIALHDAAVQAERDQKFADIGFLADKALELADLPPATNGLAMGQARLKRALDPMTKAIDAQDITHNLFCTRRPGHDCYVRMKASACSMLEAGSAVLGVPPDHLLVTIVAAAFACISNQLEVKLSLIVPMRDGAGEGNAIANASTTRHLELWLGGKRSLLDAALDLSQRLRRREWEVCDVIGDDGDRVFVNVRDIPKLEGARAVMEDVDTNKNTSKFVRNIMEMFIDKESETSWAFIIGIRDDLCGTRFGQALKQCLWNLAIDPLGAAIPALPPPEATMEAAS